MRIAPEEALTRLVALGVPAVYEISNNFRTEERQDQTHLFEFDSVEALYAEQELGVTFSVMEEVCREVAHEVSRINGKPEHPLETQSAYKKVNDYRLTPVASRLECNSRYCMIISSVTLPDVVEKYPRAQKRHPQ